MRTLATSAILIGSLAIWTVTYETSPYGAAWFQEGRFVEQPESEGIPDANSDDPGILKKHTNQGQMEAPKYTREAYVDFKATGPPQMDDYPKSPEEAAKSSSSTTKSADNIANYGYYKSWVEDEKK